MNQMGFFDYILEKYTDEKSKAIDLKAENPNIDVLCPRCGKELHYKAVKNSYEVRRYTENCIKTSFRGIKAQHQKASRSKNLLSKILCIKPKIILKVKMRLVWILMKDAIFTPTI